MASARAHAIWDRARRFDLEAGGRFDRRAAAVLFWSAPFDAATGDRARLVGAFHVRWHDPTAPDRLLSSALTERRVEVWTTTI